MSARDPRWAAAMEEGRRQFDAAGYIDRPGVPSPWQPGDREASARAYAQLATALPEGWSRPKVEGQALLKPRRLAPVHTTLCPIAAQVDRIHSIAGGK